MNQRLGPDRRLHARAEFVRAYDEGRKRHGRFVIVFVVPTSRPVARLGVSVTRKYGGAVARNLAKRRVREIFRRVPLAPGMDVVVVPKREFPDACFAELDADLRATLARSADSRAVGERRGARAPGRRGPDRGPGPAAGV